MATNPLAAAVAGFGQQLGGRMMQLQDEERLRAQRVQDVNDNRAYAESRYNVERADRREDRDEADRRAMQQVLIQHGYLSPNDLGNPDAVQQAFQQAQRDGLVQRYQTLVSGGYLSADEVSNPEAVSEALDAWGKESKTSREHEQTAKANAQQTVNRLADREIQISRQMDDIQQELSASQQGPTQAQVQTRAMQIAQESAGGSMPSQADIQAATAQAEEELLERAQMNSMLRQRELIPVLTSLSRELQDTRDRTKILIQNFKIAPAISEVPAAVNPAAEPRAQREATPKERAAAIRAAVGGLTGNTESQGTNPLTDPATPNEYQPLAGGDRDPLIAQENARRQQRFTQATFQQPMAEAQQRLSEIDRQIARTRQPDPRMLTPAGPWMVDTPSAPATSNRAAELSALYQERDALQQNLQTLAARFKQPAQPDRQPQTPSQPRVVSEQVFTTNRLSPIHASVQMAPAYY